VGKVVGKACYLNLDQARKELFSLPGGWLPTHFGQPEEREETIPSLDEMLLEVLSKPERVSPLKDLASKAKNIVMIVDDLTRPTPTSELLRILLLYLKDSGCSHKPISVVVGLGTHDSLSREKLEINVGKEVLATCSVFQHNAKQSDLVPIPAYKGERTVHINPVVAHSDLRIGISSILPHPMAGFGGGPKIIMPGVADFESIKEHHIRNVIHPLSTLGVTKGNPFHEGCFKVAQAVGLHFSINCVYNQKAQVIRIVAGSLESAFARAVDLCFENLGHRCDHKFDVVIASTFPHIHGAQLLKGLIAPAMVTEEKGAILLVAPLVQPISQEFIDCIKEIRKISHNNPAEYIRRILSKGRAIFPDKSIDLNMALTKAFLRTETRVILVSQLVSEGDAAIMGLDHASSIEEGLSWLEEYYPHARVAIFPSGGFALPIFTGQG
jgi:nickel-dependent lactate racemase